MITNPVEYPVGPDLGAELMVALAGAEGSIQVWEGIAGDVGDAAGEPCGAVDGRPAMAYSMLGGVMVQWSDEGWWYGVFSRDVERGAIIDIATAMQRVLNEGS